MILSTAYDLISPLLLGQIEELLEGNFGLPALYAKVAWFFGVLLISVVCTLLYDIP